MGHYSDHYSYTAEQHYNEHKESLLREISQELETDRPNTELDVILHVIQNSKRYVDMIDLLKELNKK